MSARIEIHGTVTDPALPPWGDGTRPTVTNTGWTCHTCPAQSNGNTAQIADHLIERHGIAPIHHPGNGRCGDCGWTVDPHSPTTSWAREHEMRHRGWALTQADVLTTFADLEQRSPEWHAARCGLITASTVGRLVTMSSPPADTHDCPECAAPAGEPCVSLRGGKPIKTTHSGRVALAADLPQVPTVADSDTARAIIATLAAERISGRHEDAPMTSDMWRGVEAEPYAREAYAKWRGVTVDEVAFMVRNVDGVRIGCSPDGLVGDDGGIEIKSPRAKSHVLNVAYGTTPMAYMAQLQTFLLVSGRRWVDLISFHGGLALWSQRIMPDPRWQTAIIAAATAAEAAIEDLVARYEAAARELPTTDPLPDPFDVEIAL